MEQCNTGSVLIASQLSAHTNCSLCQLNYRLSEVINPQHDLPRIISSSVVVVCVIYTLVNIAYLAVLGPAVVGVTKVIAIDFCDALFGKSSGAGVMIAVAVAFSALSANNASILTGSRVLFASAVAGQLPSAVGRLNPITRTPTTALAIQCVWGCLLVIPSSFDKLLSFFGFGTCSS